MSGLLTLTAGLSSVSAPCGRHTSKFFSTAVLI
jgi:hypothetical protein